MVTGFFSEEEVAPLTGKAIGMELPEVMAAKVQVLREWAKKEGERAECALFCAFHPPIAEIDAKTGRAQGSGFNPTGVNEMDVAHARRTLIRIRDAFLMPTIWDAELTVLFSHAIAALHDLQTRCMVTGLETDGAGEETG
jgi:hypothetical protein